jgi:hypothetical protein
MSATDAAFGGSKTIRPRQFRWRSLIEPLALAVAPAAAYFGLRIRLMPVPDLNDPAMHTTFMIQPASIFLRYTSSFTPTFRLREASRVGLLVPGRISYLLFGALPGFIVLRYLLALIAIVPAYLLLRRLYGRWAGAVAVVVVLTSPVLITAWGTDFPDSVAVSYLIAGTACLAMPSQRHRVWWLAGSAGFFTLSLWSIATSLPLIAVAVVVYAVVRFVRDRPHMLRDGVVAGCAALGVTGVLAIASGLLIGPFDFVVPTIQSVMYLAQPANEIMNHSHSWRWAPFVTYLLVPPTVVVAWLIAFGYRLRKVPTPQLVIGLTCAAQLVLCTYLQIFGGLQILEVHFFSSLLWASVSLALAIALVELGRPLLAHGRFKWLLPVLLLALPLVYELLPHVGAFGWFPLGYLVAAIALACALIARWLWRMPLSVPTRVASAVAVSLVSAFLLLLTIAPIPNHPLFPGTIPDTAPAYDTAFGGDSSFATSLYVVTTDLPAFVGPGTYSGERLLMWWPLDERDEILGPIGIFHAFFNSLPGEMGVLSPDARLMIQERGAAQILLMSFTGDQFEQSLQALSPFQPVLVKSGVLRSGSVALHVWLIDLKQYFRGPT